MKNRRVVWLVFVITAMVIALLSLIPLHLFAPANFLTNQAPVVAPALREWHGSSGSFALAPDSRIILDPAYANQLQATAHVFQQDLRAEINASLPIIISNKLGAGNFFLTLKTLDSGIGN